MNYEHIADIKCAEFYIPAFPTPNAARQFVERVESLPPESSVGKIILHQAARFIWLADRMDDVAFGRPALKILFFLIVAEAVAKLAYGFEGEGRSRQFVRRFFLDFTSPTHRERLATAFQYIPSGPFLNAEKAIDLLYDVRCDVVHEGMYYGFQLRDAHRPGRYAFMTRVGDHSWIVSLTAEELRDIVLGGAVSACQFALERKGIQV